nr:immunoglobulin light chain junction region [Macaca mulatta]
CSTLDSSLSTLF